MLVGACYTLYKMRKNLINGVKRSIADVKKSAAAAAATARTEQDLSLKVVGLGIAVLFVLMSMLYSIFTGTIGAAIIAAIVILITGFFFAAVSGNLVGMIGSSNNPLSGLTLATTIVAALTMVLVGAKGTEGVMAVLGVAAVGCVSAAVAGEMLQDLKVGHILGGTPWKMQVGDLIGVVAAGLVMFFPLYMMHTADVAQFGAAVGGFGGKTYPAPQAGLMAALAQGIVGGEMAWPLVFVGIAMGISLILIKVRSPMLFSVGMYLPLGNDVRDLLRRDDPRRRGQDPRQARLQRRAEGAGRERGCAGSLGPDSGRGAARAVHCGRGRHTLGARVLVGVRVLRYRAVARHPCVPLLGLVPGGRPAAQGWRGRRAGATDGDHVGGGYGMIRNAARALRAAEPLPTAISRM